MGAEALWAVTAGCAKAVLVVASLWYFIACLRSVAASSPSALPSDGVKKAGSRSKQVPQNFRVQGKKGREAVWLYWGSAKGLWQVSSHVLLQGFFLGKKESCRVWIQSCEGKNTCGLFLAKPQATSKSGKPAAVLGGYFPIMPLPFSGIHHTLPAGICRVFSRILKRSLLGGGQRAVRDTARVWAASDRFLSLLPNRPVRTDSTCLRTAWTQRYQPKRDVLMALCALCVLIQSSSSLCKCLNR